tara:strand:- start:607 stop:1335 length:729 start_codon:yes stop_codon:yes gene_type:complete
MVKWTDRSPFYFIGTIFLLASIILSIVMTIQTKKNFADFFPEGKMYDGKYICDNFIGDKIMWYFSQITHQTQFLLFLYFLLAFFNNKSDLYFKIIAPLCLTVSALYFYLLFPKQNQKIYQLSFCNFFSHFMIIFLVFGELYYVKNYNFNETSYCLIFLISTIIITFINYGIRGVWSYNLIKLNEFYGWLLIVKTVLVIYFFSFLLYFIKPGKHIKQPYYRNAPFLSGILNIIFFLWFIYKDK